VQRYRPLKTIGRALSHFHWLLWGMALVAGTLAFGAAFARHPTYEATATLTLYEANSTSQGFDLAMQADQYLTQRFIALATSRPVLEQVCATEGGSCDPVALAKRVQATTPKATGQVSITASSSSPSGAATLANDVANELVNRNRAEVDAVLSPERTYLQQQLDSIGGSINSTQQQIQQIQNTGRTDASIGNALSPLLSKLNLLQGQYANTYAKLQDLDVVAAQRAATLSLYEPAVAPSKPADPDPVRYVGVGVVGGLIVGFLLALLAERFRDRIEDGTELAEAAGCSIVLDLGGRVDPTTMGPYGFLAQASLQARQRDGRTILLVAASVKDRVDSVGEALARAAAQVHHRVLIVPTNGVDRPQRREIPAGNGSMVVVGGLGMPGRNSHTSRNGDRFDLTIHCALPPMADATTPWSRPPASAAILVATQGSTRLSEARRTAEQLRLVGIELAAAVLLPRAPRWQRDSAWNVAQSTGERAPARGTLDQTADESVKRAAEAESGTVDGSIEAMAEVETRTGDEAPTEA
jgi:capsular polysaccharide biosynthesis protein